MEDESTVEYKEIVERKGGRNGNYLLKCLSSKNKGKINKSSYPSNHLKSMSSGTLTYPTVAIPVNLSMVLKVKMKQRKHPVQMMMQQRFLFVHQWTLIKLCQILQLMNLLHHCMFVHHLCLLDCHMFVHHPSPFLVIHQAVQFLLPI